MFVCDLGLGKCIFFNVYTHAQNVIHTFERPASDKQDLVVHQVPTVEPGKNRLARGLEVYTTHRCQQSKFDHQTEHTASVCITQSKKPCYKNVITEILIIVENRSVTSKVVKFKQYTSSGIYFYNYLITFFIKAFTCLLYTSRCV